MELPLTHPELYEDIGIKPPKVQAGRVYRYIHMRVLEAGVMWGLRSGRICITQHHRLSAGSRDCINAARVRGWGWGVGQGEAGRPGGAGLRLGRRGRRSGSTSRTTPLLHYAPCSSTRDRSSAHRRECLTRHSKGPPRTSPQTRARPTPKLTSTNTRVSAGRHPVRRARHRQDAAGQGGGQLHLRHLPARGGQRADPEVPGRRAQAGARAVPGGRRARALHRVHR